jgi:hypothetical protein
VTVNTEVIMIELFMAIMYLLLALLHLAKLAM